MVDASVRGEERLDYIVVGRAATPAVICQGWKSMSTEHELTS